MEPGFETQIMAERQRTPDDFDSPWKDALHMYLPWFLAFFSPDIHADIDWSNGYEVLDKEFQQIVRRAKIGKRLADKLFKVQLRDGTSRWLLIHVEIQADYEKEFPERMFDYHVAARQLYNQEVVSLAILCDDNPQWRPTTFVYANWGCRIELTYRIAKLIDWRSETAILEASENPFATVVLAHLNARKTHNDPEARTQSKLHLVKGLYRGNWTPDDIRRLFRLIDWMLVLPDEFTNRFWAEFESFEEEENVDYITSVERMGIQKGLEEGLEKGIEKGLEKGLEQGIEKGLRKGLLEGIALNLETRFGADGLKLMRKTRALDVAGLRKLTRFLKKATTVDEVRAYFA